MADSFFEAYVGADLFGTSQAPTSTQVIRSDGRAFQTFYNLCGGRIPVPVQLVREVPRPGAETIARERERLQSALANAYGHDASSIAAAMLRHFDSIYPPTDGGVR
jgi:hypothetical protein